MWADLLDPQKKATAYFWDGISLLMMQELCAEVIQGSIHMVEKILQVFQQQLRFFVSFLPTVYTKFEPEKNSVSGNIKYRRP